MHLRALRGTTMLVIVAAWIALVLWPSLGAAQEATKPVTVLVYIGADRDANHEGYAFDDINEMELVGSTPDVNIVVQVDPFDGSSFGGVKTPLRYLIVQDDDPNHIASPVLSTVPESSTGDPDTLVEFFSWATQLFPAQRVYLILSDHWIGSGWKPRGRQTQTFAQMGFLYDQTDGGDYLTVKELADALGRIKAIRTSVDYPTGKNIEFLAFDGGQAGLIEIAYEIKDSVDLVAFSQIDEPSEGYPYDAMLALITDDPTGSVESLAGDWVTAYVTAAASAGGEEEDDGETGGEGDTGDDGGGMGLVPSISRQVDARGRAASMSLAQSVVDCRLLPTIPPPLGVTGDTETASLLRHLLDDAGALRDNFSAIAVARDGDPPVADPGVDVTYYDLVTFLQNLADAAQNTDPITATRAGSVLTAVQNAIVAEAHQEQASGRPVENLNGLSIYFPSEQPLYDSTYTSAVTFATFTRWAEFLVQYYSLANDSTKPRIAISTPINGASISDTRPVLRANITDSGSGVDPASIVLELDGAVVQLDPITDYFDSGTGVLEFTPTTSLSIGSHTISVDAADRAGNRADTATVSFRVVRTTISQGLQMVSVPYANVTNSPSFIFGVASSNFSMARWVPTATASGNKYAVYPDPYATFNPPDADPNDPSVGGLENVVVPNPPAGLGYWIRLPADSIVGDTGGTAVSGPYTMFLRVGTTRPRGWNMIGCPFLSAVSLGSAEFTRGAEVLDLGEAIDAGWLSGAAYEFVASGSGGFYRFMPIENTVLEPWKGYWIRVYKDVKMTLYPPGRGAAVHTAATPTEVPTPSNWRVQLVAQAGDAMDPCNYLGVASSAAEGPDRGDFAEPPSIVDELNLYFPHPQWGPAAGRYAQDLRAAFTGSKSWDVAVDCKLVGETVTLSWPNLAAAPRGLRFILDDLDSGKSIYMRTAGSYSYQATEGTRHFRITATAEGTSGLVVTGLSVEPVRGGAQHVTYRLSKDAAVTVQVYNIAGRLIRTIVNNAPQRGGLQSATWDARSSEGAAVPAGTYLLKVTARSECGEQCSAVRTMMVMP